MSPFEEFVSDNPILRKHLRTELRTHLLVPALGSVALFVVLVILPSTFFDSSKFGPMAGRLFISAAWFVMQFFGTQRVSASIRQSRELGVFEFNRISPLSPFAIFFGYVFGAPVRSLLCASCLAACAVFSAALSGPQELLGLGVFSLFLCLNTALIFTLAGFLGFATRVPSTFPVTAALLIWTYLSLRVGVVDAFGLAQMSQFLLPNSSNSGVQQGLVTQDLFSAAIRSLAAQVPLMILLILGAARKISSPFQIAITKKNALAFFVVMTLLFNARIWGDDVSIGLSLETVYRWGGLVVGMVLTYAVTPNSSIFMNASRSRASDGTTIRKRISDDSALNVWFFLSAALIYILKCTGFASSGALPDKQQLVALFAALNLWAQFAISRQYFELAFPRKAASFFNFYLIVSWIFPILLTLVIFGAAHKGDLGFVPLAFCALSPLTLLYMQIGDGSAPSFLSRPGSDGAAQVELSQLFSVGYGVIIIGALSLLLWNKQRHLMRVVAGKKSLS